MATSLTSILARLLNVDEDQARVQLEAYVNRIQGQIQDSGTSELKGVGTFAMRDGQLVFRPTEDLAHLVNREFAGLEPVVLDSTEVTPGYRNREVLNFEDSAEFELAAPVEEEVLADHADQAAESTSSAEPAAASFAESFWDDNAADEGATIDSLFGDQDADSIDEDDALDGYYEDDDYTEASTSAVETELFGYDLDEEDAADPLDFSLDRFDEAEERSEPAAEVAMDHAGSFDVPGETADDEAGFPAFVFDDEGEEDEIEATADEQADIELPPLAEFREADEEYDSDPWAGQDADDPWDDETLNALIKSVQNEPIDQLQDPEELLAEADEVERAAASKDNETGDLEMADYGPPEVETPGSLSDFLREDDDTPFTIEKLDDFGTVAGSDSDTQPDDQEFMPAEFFGEAAAAQEQDEFDLPIPNGDAVVEPLSQDGVEQDDAGQDDTAGDFLFFGDDDEESAPAFEPDPLEHSAFTIGFEDTEEQTDALDELAGPPPLPGSLASAAQLAAEDDDEDARRLSELEEWFTSEDAEQGKLPDWIAEAAATAQGSTAAPWSAPPEPAAAPTGAPSGDAAPPLEPPKNRKPKRSSAERARSRRLRTLTFVVIGLFLLAAFIGWLTFLRPDPGAQPAEPEVATIPAPETQPTPAPAEPAPPTYDAAGVGDVVFVVASRPTEDQARDFADNLSGSGLPVTIAPATLSNGEVWYRVMLGVYGSPEDAEASRPELPSPVRGEAWVLEL